MQRYQSVEAPLSCFDIIQNYYGVASIWLGIIILVFGLLSMSLGIAAICTLSSGYYIAYGIWCGFIFSVTGILCIMTGYKKTACLIVGTLVFCMLSVCLGAVQLSLGIVAANNDSPHVRHDNLIRPMQEGYLDYDIYYEKNNPYQYLCSGPNKPFKWVTSWGPVDILLLIAGFIEFVAALIAAILSCHSSCYGLRSVSFMSKTSPGSVAGFTNEGYMTTDHRITTPTPPVYKLGM
jgi:hypothetical protein